MMKRLIFLVCSIAAIGCTDLFGPTTGAFPSNTVQYAALDSYPVWWVELEQCSGITGDLSKVSFWDVQGAFNFQMPRDTNLIVYGYFVVPMDIILAEQSMEFKPEVQHEMLHALLYMQFGLKYYNEKNAHPDEYFKQRCPFVMQEPG